MQPRDAIFFALPASRCVQSLISAGPPTRSEREARLAGRPRFLRGIAICALWVGIGFCQGRIMPGRSLIYRKPSEETLWLARLGSHSELFGRCIFLSMNIIEQRKVEGGAFPGLEIETRGTRLIVSLKSLELNQLPSARIIC